MRARTHRLAKRHVEQVGDDGAGPRAGAGRRDADEEREGERARLARRQVGQLLVGAVEQRLGDLPARRVG